MGKKNVKNEKAPVTNPRLGKPLDDTPPTQEQYNRFYALAKRIFDAAPWEYMEECQVLAVERNADETDFVSVMGAIQQHYAVAVYPTFACLDRVMSISECSGQEARDIMFNIPQLQLVYDSKTRLYPGEREAIAASGVRFKNGKWPSAQAYVPGYFPWKVGTGVMDDFCVALEQLLAKVTSEDRDIPDFLDRDDPMCTRTCRCGVWSEAVRQHAPKIFKEPIALPVDLLEAVRKLPVRVQCVEADCFPLLMPTGKAGTRMVCPRQMVLVDRASGLALAFELLMPEEGKEWSFVTAIPVFLTLLDRLGYRPATMAFAGGITEAWATPLCAMLGIRVEQSPCEALLDYRAEMEDFFTRR